MELREALEAVKAYCRGRDTCDGCPAEVLPNSDTCWLNETGEPWVWDINKTIKVIEEIVKAIEQIVKHTE